MVPLLTGAVVLAEQPGASDWVLRPVSELQVDGGVEIVVYDEKHRRFHAIGERGRMELGFDDSGQVALLRTHVFSTTQAWEATSISIDPLGRGFGVVTWVPQPPDSMPGIAQVIDLESGDPVWQFNIGYHPDCVVFTPDGRLLLAANEGEAHTTDRPGAITVAQLDGIASARDFIGFNAVQSYSIDAPHLAEGVDLSTLRIAPEHAAAPSVNIEPEYIAPGNTGAWVSLQENNGLAYFEFESRTWTRVLPLPPLSFAFDAAHDGALALQSGEGFGLLPMPDTIVMYTAGERSFVVTANEGDKTAGHELRLAEAVQRGLVDPARVDALHASFGDLEEHGIGRLYISTIDGDLDGDGDLDLLCPQGGRSVSIIDAESGVVVWNSGPQMELITGMLYPERYNAQDSRSVRAGPEPEGLAIAHWDGRTLLAVGLERTDVVMLYDISDPFSPAYLASAPISSGCAGPEGLVFYERENRLYLAVAGEKGGCLTLYEVSN